MIKHSGNAQKAHADLQVALDRMLKVLKNLNDSLHVVGLKGFPVRDTHLNMIVYQIITAANIHYTIVLVLFSCLLLAHTTASTVIANPFFSR